MGRLMADTCVGTVHCLLYMPTFHNMGRVHYQLQVHEYERVVAQLSRELGRPAPVVGQGSGRI
jgi:hypothetical protein